MGLPSFCALGVVGVSVVGVSWTDDFILVDIYVVGNSFLDFHYGARINGFFVFVD